LHAFTDQVYVSAANDGDQVYEQSPPTTHFNPDVGVGDQVTNLVCGGVTVPVIVSSYDNVVSE
jgi:hypothetical protein